MSRLYDTDFSSWADETARLLVERRFEEIDLEALIEEVHDLAGRHRDAYQSYLRVIIEHLLKIVYAPDSIYNRNQRGWCGSASTARDDIEILLQRNAGAARDQDEALATAFKYGLRKVKRDGHDFGPVDWPDVCPWTIEQLLDPDFFPNRGTRRA